MTAYWVNTFTAIRDEERVRRYAALAGPAMTAAGGRFLARGNPVHVLEGDNTLRTTIIEFPSADAARAAYDSPAYQEALAALGDGATREIRVVEGGVSGHVVVVGAINVDLVVAAPRLPGPGETVVGGSVARHGGGKGANAAVAAARAGSVVRLVGAVGHDDTGEAALAELRAEGVDTAAVAVLPGAATGVALIVVDARGENQIAVGAGANAALSAAHVDAALADVLPGAGCVLVSTEIPGDAVAAAVEAAAAAGVVSVLNPAPVLPVVPELLALHPILTPNASESRDLAALLGDAAADPTGAARAIGGRSGAPVVVTLGGDGALVLAPGGAPEPVPPRPATVRDTTGAGDTFNGVLAARLAAQDGLAAAVDAASAAAALSVGHVGARTGMPDAAAIAAALDGGG